jgi:hypothetical protein
MINMNRLSLQGGEAMCPNEQGGKTMSRRDSASSYYCLISGTALLILGVSGFFVSDLWGVLQFDLAHNLLHLVGGGLAVSAALIEKEALATLYAQGSGVVYVLLAIAGLVSPTLWGVGDTFDFQLGLAESIFHLILGGWGLSAGFAPWDLPGLRGMIRA